ncbi:MAG: 4Fe-4S binding protein, partial [Gemmatimonadota bacterium]|nr:4Fe-4S binding protein [Gemmatimonadota bacterium]
MRFEINQKCVSCMACVRVCPTDAIAVEETGLWILDDACVRTGLCYEACPHDAIDVIGDRERVRDLLDAGGALLVLAGEAAVHFHPHAMEQVVNACFRLGFAGVHHGVIGEELVAEAYLRLWADESWRTLIRSTCPVLVECVRSDYPELVKYLAPVVTPLQAEVRALRRGYGADVPIVFAGVCLADAVDTVDAALTLNELGDLFAGAAIALEEQPVYFHRIPGERRRYVSTPGGMPLPLLH